MLKPAANLSMLYQDRPFAERCHAAKGAGFSGVEFLYQPDFALRYLRQLLRDSGLMHVLANMEGSPHDKGLAAVHGREGEFKDRFERSLAAAEITQASMLHVTAGIVSPDEHERATEVFHKNMSWAGGLAAKAGVALVIEAINQKDVPGYFLRSLDDATRWCQTLWEDNTYLIFDLYHAGMEGLQTNNLVSTVVPWTKHLQIASVPRRNEPVLSEEVVDTLRALLKNGFGGWIGCEYRPAGKTEDGLGWLVELNEKIKGDNND